MTSSTRLYKIAVVPETRTYYKGINYLQFSHLFMKNFYMRIKFTKIL